MFNPMFNEIFGRVVVAKRMERKITQAQLAKKLGFSAQFLGRCEKGMAPFPIKSIIKMQKPLRLFADEIADIAAECAEEYVHEVIR